MLDYFSWTNCIVFCMGYLPLINQQNSCYWSSVMNGCLYFLNFTIWSLRYLARCLFFFFSNFMLSGSYSFSLYATLMMVVWHVNSLKKNFKLKFPFSISMIFNEKRKWNKIFRLRQWIKDQFNWYFSRQFDIINHSAV